MHRKTWPEDLQTVPYQINVFDWAHWSRGRCLRRYQDAAEVGLETAGVEERAAAAEVALEMEDVEVQADAAAPAEMGAEAQAAAAVEVSLETEGVQVRAAAAAEMGAATTADAAAAGAVAEVQAGATAVEAGKAVVVVAAPVETAAEAAAGAGAVLATVEALGADPPPSPAALSPDLWRVPRPADHLQYCFPDLTSLTLHRHQSKVCVIMRISKRLSYY